MIASIPMLAWRALRWNALRGGWLREYLLRHRGFSAQRFSGDGPVDVIVTLVDHYEPARKKGPQAAVASVASWLAAYERSASAHRDADGLHPRHTWFYRSEYRNRECLRQLCESTFRGFGEIEFHLHHGHDTHESFSQKLSDGLDWFNEAGAMLTAEPEPRRRFAYIAGNWALDNGAGNDAFSGCNTELAALREQGCYADFTFPALGSVSQPSKTNAIYYATDDPGPKSYDRGVDACVGVEPRGDLMIFQGPLVIDWRAAGFEEGALESGKPPSAARLAAWIDGNVHVRERPEWIFIKLHTHGMQSRDAILGPGMQAMWSAMEREWNTDPFRLHFTTAREAYNIVRAAEAGRSGNPGDYRDFEIPRSANSRICCNSPWKLVAYDERRLCLEVLDGRSPAEILFRDHALRKVEGRVKRIDLRLDGGKIAAAEVQGDGLVRLHAADGAILEQRVDGAAGIDAFSTVPGP